MRLPHVPWTALLCLLAGCGTQDSGSRQASATPPGQTTYAECMQAAEQKASRAQTVMKAGECLRLPDAPAPGSTLPPGIPPPPGREEAEAETDDAAAPIHSLYTSLPPEQCRVVQRHEETGGTVSRCPGVAGHALLVSDDDARMSIDVVRPDGKAHPLNYWSVVTQAFSSLGPRAEWRMRGTRPIALIVRVNANEDPENPERVTSYLAVAKIAPGSICVTDRIAPAANANELARRAADASSSRPCAPEAGTR